MDPNKQITTQESSYTPESSIEKQGDLIHHAVSHKEAKSNRVGMTLLSVFYTFLGLFTAGTTSKYYHYKAALIDNKMGDTKMREIAQKHFGPAFVGTASNIVKESSLKDFKKATIEAKELRDKVVKNKDRPIRFKKKYKEKSSIDQSPTARMQSMQTKGISAGIGLDLAKRHLVDKEPITELMGSLESGASLEAEANQAVYQGIEIRSPYVILFKERFDQVMAEEAKKNKEFEVDTHNILKTMVQLKNEAEAHKKRVAEDIQSRTQGELTYKKLIKDFVAAIFSEEPSENAFLELFTFLYTTKELVSGNYINDKNYRNLLKTQMLTTLDKAFSRSKLEETTKTTRRDSLRKEIDWFFAIQDLYATQDGYVLDDGLKQTLSTCPQLTELFEAKQRDYAKLDAVARARGVELHYTNHILGSYLEYANDEEFIRGKPESGSPSGIAKLDPSFYLVSFRSKKIEGRSDDEGGQYQYGIDGQYHFGTEHNVTHFIEFIKEEGGSGYIIDPHSNVQLKFENDEEAKKLLLQVISTYRPAEKALKAGSHEIEIFEVKKAGSSGETALK